MKIDLEFEIRKRVNKISEKYVYIKAYIDYPRYCRYIQEEGDKVIVSRKVHAQNEVERFKLKKRLRRTIRKR